MSSSFLAGYLTRNSSSDLIEFKTRSNSAGIDTSKLQVIPLDALLNFLDHFQRENCGEDGAKHLIEVI